MDDGDLIRIQAETLFTYDGRGRMVRDNVLDGGDVLFGDVPLIYHPPEVSMMGRTSTPPNLTGQSLAISTA